MRQWGAIGLGIGVGLVLGVIVVSGLLVGATWPVRATAVSAVPVTHERVSASVAGTSGEHVFAPAASSQQKAWIIGGVVAIGAGSSAVAAAAAATAQRNRRKPRK